MIHAFDNKNRPILAGHEPVDRVYFNLIKLATAESDRYHLPQFETVVVPMAGVCDVTIDGVEFANLGGRADVWAGKADSVYAGPGADVAIVARSDCEIAIAGGSWTRAMPSFRIRPEEIDVVEVGSNETESRRRFFISWDRTVQVALATCLSVSFTRMRVVGPVTRRTSTILISRERLHTRRSITGASTRQPGSARSSGTPLVAILQRMSRGMETHSPSLPAIIQP